MSEDRIGGQFGGRAGGKTDRMRRMKIAPITVFTEEADSAWEAHERLRNAALEKAKTDALAWLQRGDVAGALVKFVAETLKPVLEGGRPIIDWWGATGSTTLLMLGKSYLPRGEGLSPWEALLEQSAARQNMERWIVGFR